MKKTRSILFTVAILFGTLIATTSCDSDEDLRADCEINNWGGFIVQNTTGYTVWVDVDDIDERILYHGGQTVYNQVQAGNHKMYIDFGDGWQYYNQYLNSCETLTYTWYLDGKKSTGNIRLEISVDGTVRETISELETDMSK